MDGHNLVTVGDGHVIDAFTVAYHPAAVPFVVPRHQVLQSVQKGWSEGERATVKNASGSAKIISIEEDKGKSRSPWPYLPKWQGITVEFPGDAAPSRVSAWELERLESGCGGPSSDGQRTSGVGGGGGGGSGSGDGGGGSGSGEGGGEGGGDGEDDDDECVFVREDDAKMLNLPHARFDCRK